MDGSSLLWLLLSIRLINTSTVFVMSAPFGYQGTLHQFKNDQQVIYDTSDATQPLQPRHYKQDDQHTQQQNDIFDLNGILSYGVV
ncbi:unnamed protein product [Absidia cylindrospora]